MSVGMAVSWSLPAIVWLLGVAAAGADEGLGYSSVVRTEPRPLRIHVLKLDLESPAYQPVVVVNADPDGDGPAEAALDSPEAMAARAGLVAAVNSAVFGGLPDASGRRSERWAVGMPVEILGWTMADGRERSGSEPPRHLKRVRVTSTAGSGAAKVSSLWAAAAQRSSSVRRPPSPTRSGLP